MKIMQGIKKRDVILIAVFLAVGLGMLLILSMLDSKGEKAQVKVDGEVIGSWTLNEDAVIEVPLQSGEVNVLRIEKGEIYMEQANCPDGLCIRMGRISKTEQSIVCLPHKVSVEIVGGDGDIDIDGVVR